MNRFCTALALTFLIFANAHSEETANPPVCLLTGFQPFGGAKRNPSWETVRKLNGETVAGYKVVSVELPVVYDEMEAPLIDAIKVNKPAMIICFGQGGDVLSLEQTARNGYHPAKPPDNLGKPPPRTQIVPDGPAEKPSTLPVEEIMKSLKEAKIGAQSSTDAGGYLCNECFYRLMTFAKEGADGIQARGFVHVPRFGVHDPEGGIYTPEKVLAAVKIIVTVTAKFRAKSPK